MSNIDVFRSGGLPSRENIRSFIAEAAARAPATYSGKQYLKCDPYTGKWTFGKDSTPVEKDSLWAINPISFFNGFMAWGDGKVLGEHRQPANRSLPDVASLGKTEATRGWEEMRGCELVCITGEHAGTVCEFRGTSDGAIRGVDDIIRLIGVQDDRNSDAIVPIVHLRDNGYENKKYHRWLYPPAFEVEEWRTFEDASPPAAQEAKAEPDQSGDDLIDEYEQIAGAEVEADDTPRRRVRRF